MDALAELLQSFKSYYPNESTELLTQAYRFAQNAHQSQQRASQEPYFSHPLAVAQALLDLKLDLPTLCAGLLHDVLEDTPVTYDQIKKQFSEEIANLVEGVTKLDRFQYKSSDEFQAENWRKMLLAMAKDIRVILIKLVDRLHNMRTIEFLPQDDQKRIARETLSLYAPIADRLGMFEIKSELEDLAFAVVEPAIFNEIKAGIDQNTPGREKYLRDALNVVNPKINSLGTPCRSALRAKNIYSIYRKMVRQKKRLEEIEDTMAVRFITDTVANCYAILGEVHATFKPVPGTFTDYIAHPKANLYQSLHTTLYGPDEKLFETQIRTEEMHRQSEYGIASHWKYKLGNSVKLSDKQLEERLNWLRESLEWLQDLKSPEEFLDSLKTELKVHRIFVFTPTMQVKSLAEGATPIDFAYCVHSDIGNTCVGAKVNGKMVRLNYELKSGDVCEILTARKNKPNKDWLTFVKTARARSHIRRKLKHLS